MEPNAGPYAAAMSPVKVAVRARAIRQGTCSTRVLNGVALPLRRVSPVVFSDELFDRPRRQGLTDRGGLDVNLEIEGAVLHTARQCVGATVHLHSRPHRHRAVRLVVVPAGEGGNGMTRHELTKERDAASNLAVDDPAHVEPQIHFFEGTMAGHRHTKHARVGKQESDDRHVVHAVEGIELTTRRYVRHQKLRCHLPVQHRHVKPPGGEEWTGHREVKAGHALSVPSLGSEAHGRAGPARVSGHARHAGNCRRSHPHDAPGPAAH